MKRFLFLSTILLLPLYVASGQAIGTTAPDFTLNSLDHGQIALANYQGQVVYLFFFGYA